MNINAVISVSDTGDSTRVIEINCKEKRTFYTQLSRFCNFYFCLYAILLCCSCPVLINTYSKCSYTLMCMFAGICEYVWVCSFVCLCVCVFVCVFVCLFTWVPVCLCVHACFSLYFYTYS